MSGAVIVYSTGFVKSLAVPPGGFTVATSVVIVGISEVTSVVLGTWTVIIEAPIVLLTSVHIEALLTFSSEKDTIPVVLCGRGSSSMFVTNTSIAFKLL